MKNLPIGIQTFSEIINENYLYIDKTQGIYNLFAQGGKYWQDRCDIGNGKPHRYLEFKIGTSEEAIAQIKEKRYYEPYIKSGKSITLVGIGIDPTIRNIRDYRLEDFIS